MKKKRKKRHFRTFSRMISLLLVLIMLTNDFLGGGTIVLSAETSGNIETEADVDTGESTEDTTEDETNEEDSNSKEQDDSKKSVTESDSDTEENTSDEVQTESASDFLAVDEPQTVLILEEDVSKRTSNIKYFQNEDHSYTAAIYPDPVHYEEDGEWKEIDNQLVNGEAEEGTQFLENKENLFKVKFSKKSNGSKLVKVKIDDFDISWDLKGADKVDAVPIEQKNNSVIPSVISDEEESMEGPDEEMATIFTECPKAAQSGVENMDEAEAVYGNKMNGVEKYNNSMGILSEEQETYEDTDDVNEETLDVSYYEKMHEENQEMTEIKNLSSGVIYEEIFPNVDIEYMIHSQKLKENIILKNSKAQNEFVFQLKVNGLELEEKKMERYCSLIRMKISFLRCRNHLLMMQMGNIQTK